MRAPSLRPFTEFLLRHPGMTFVLMGAAFLLFGLTSVNLYVLIVANLTLIADYGAMAIADGALQQLAELTGSLVLAIAFYLVFALCERILVRRLTEKPLRERAVE